MGLFPHALNTLIRVFIRFPFQLDQLQPTALPPVAHRPTVEKLKQFPPGQGLEFMGKPAHLTGQATDVLNIRNGGKVVDPVFLGPPFKIGNDPGG